MDIKKNNLEALRHSCSHLLAAAVLKLWPKAKPTIGPSIEDGFYYDFDFGDLKISEEDLPKIEDKMQQIVKGWDKFERIEVSGNEAIKQFSNNEYKKELIEEFSNKGEKITLYKSGEFTDLCRGGHVDKPYQQLKNFKLLSIAGAYWRGSEKNKMLTRIYGTVFPTKNELDEHLKNLNEAKKRDHRVLGQQLELFLISEEVGPGLVLWLPKGTIIRQELEKWAIETEKEWGYQHVVTPHITKRHLYEISGHLPYYKDDLYSPIDIEGEEYYLKPMNCPHTHMIYKSKIRSYRDLPLRFAEYGTVYRFERSGVLHGLFRLRGFTQNDAHIYVQPNLAVEEFVKVFELHKYYYEILGIKDWWVVLGLRDPKNLRAKYHGNEKMWKKAEAMSRQALDLAGVRYEIEEGGAAHYGPKADIYIRSVIGKAYAIGTDQLDLYMPERFNLTYTDQEGKQIMPYIIHRAPLGSHERMIGFLIEHFAGAFPVWLSPTQVKVLPITERNLEYAQIIVKKLNSENIRGQVDDRNETLQAKIRDAQLEKIPYMLILGDKEASGPEGLRPGGKKIVSVRLRTGKDLGKMDLDIFIQNIKDIIEKKSLDL